MTKRQISASALAAASICLMVGARAEVSPWYVGVVGSVEHDTNVFRVGEGQSLPAGFSQSDTLYSASLIGGFDQSISRQHAYGSVSLNTGRYRSNTYLNNTSHSLKLGLDWAAAERWSGSLTASSDKSLAQFNNRTAAGVIETTKNVQTLNQLDATVALGTVTRLTIEAALGWRKRSYSADAYQYLDYDEKRASLGAKYRASGALTLGAAYRSTRTDYPNFLVLVSGDQIGSRIDRKGLDLTASWTPTGASNAYFRLSPTHIRYSNALDQSRSQLTGAAVWNWQPTDRTKVKATLTRDTGQSAQAFNFGIFGAQVVDYSTLNTALKLEASHDFTGKISATASLVTTHRDLSNSIVVVGGTPTLVDGSDRTVTPALGLTWMPTRSAQLGCNLSRERRVSSESRLTVPLSAGTYRCYGQLVLQ